MWEKYEIWWYMIHLTFILTIQHLFSGITLTFSFKLTPKCPLNSTNVEFINTTLVVVVVIDMFRCQKLLNQSYFPIFHLTLTWEKHREGEREREKKSCMSFLTNRYRKLCKLYSIDKELGNSRVPLMSWHNKIIWWRQHKSSTMLHLFNEFEVVEFHFFSPSVYAKHLYTEYLTCENHLASFKQGTENIRWPVERKKLVIHGFDWVRTGKWNANMSWNL